MIKIDKLMLGDLVRLTDGQIAKVVAIDVTGNVDVEFETESFRHHVNAHKKDINPIPLTEDILLTLNEDDAEICVFYNRESKSPYFYVEIANVEVEMKYVHQLQHLLRLCEFDELADNLKI